MVMIVLAIRLFQNNQSPELFSYHFFPHTSSVTVSLGEVNIDVKNAIAK